VNAHALAGRPILAVFAHPDDESLACGGTLARLADAGARVVLVCASRGECGAGEGLLPHERIGEARSRELREAAATLGIAEVLLLDHPDGDLRWAHVSELHAQIVLTIRHYRPAAVITFGEDGLYWHTDHIGIHERTTTAVRNLGADAPALYYVTMPPGMMRQVVDAAGERGWKAPTRGFWSLTPEAFGDSVAAPDVVINVEPWVPRKLAAIHCHRSQMGAGHPFADVPDPDSRRWLGIEHFRRADVGREAEAILECLAGC
jgi:LmbE family N-acetylglucosaminyl deacetylase